MRYTKQTPICIEKNSLNFKLLYIKLNNLFMWNNDNLKHVPGTCTCIYYDALP